MKDIKKGKNKQPFIKFTLEKRVDMLVNLGQVTWFIDGEVPSNKVCSKLIPGVTYDENDRFFRSTGDQDVGTVTLFFDKFSLKVDPILMRSNDIPVFVAKSLYKMINKVRAWVKRCCESGGIVEVEEIIDDDGFVVNVTVNGVCDHTDW